MFSACNLFTGNNQKVKINKVYREDGSLYAKYQYKDTVVQLKANTSDQNSSCCSDQTSSITDTVFEAKGIVKHGYYKGYFKDGKLRVKLQYKNGKKQGKGSKYYSTGTEQARIFYKDGKKHGKSIWFYKNGKPYRITQYVNGVIHGDRKKYYQNGQLMSVLPYKNGEARYEKLKEYTNKGVLITDYPEIKFDLDKQTDEKKLTLNIFLSNRDQNVKFFRKVKTEKGIKWNSVPTNEGMGQIHFSLLNDKYVQSTIEVKAETLTSKDNPYEILDTYYVMIDE
jgi:antitoxin component YwqK of YwqJK toxin-antitoxin module